MLKFLALIFGQWVYIPFSFLVKSILILRGCSVGKNFVIMKVPALTLTGGKVEIGDNVIIKGDLDIRTREKGKIILGNNIKIDEHVRIIAANNAVMKIGDNTNIGSFCIFNCGDNVSIGRYCLIASFCYIQSSNHGIAKGEYIKLQKHTYGSINIGDDVWIAGHVNILAGATIEDGCVIGAKSLVRGKIESQSIAVGIPAKRIKHRI